MDFHVGVKRKREIRLRNCVHEVFVGIFFALTSLHVLNKKRAAFTLPLPFLNFFFSEQEEAYHERSHAARLINIFLSTKREVLIGSSIGPRSSQC